MHNNPLNAPILTILREHPEGLSEHRLLGLLALEESDQAGSLGNSADLRLFRKHFLVMNALYQLQPIVWEEGYYLSISALHIELQLARPTPKANLETPPSVPCEAGEQALRDYYLDWQHFEQSDNASVERLLNSFWQRYAAFDQQADALAVLELTADCNWQQIRTRYRQLAAQHHPDRGGDKTEFQRIRQAYEQLSCCRIS